MLDTYGTINVEFSKGFKGNKSLLVDALNQFEFTGDYSKFMLDKSGEFIHLDCEYVIEPTIFPSHSNPACYFEKNSTNLVIKDIDNEDEELLYDYISEDAELNDIAKCFSQCIDEGGVCISYVSKPNACYRTYSFLQVNSDGTAIRYEHTDFSDRMPESIFEQV